MTPFLRFFKRLREKWIGVWYEGPEPPERLREMVFAFANMYPTATRRQWVEFASGHAFESYRSGFTRGYENVERDDDPDRDRIRPEEFADAIDPDWRWMPGIELEGDPLAVVINVGDEVSAETLVKELKELMR